MKIYSKLLMVANATERLREQSHGSYRDAFYLRRADKRERSALREETNIHSVQQGRQREARGAAIPSTLNQLETREYSRSDPTSGNRNRANNTCLQRRSFTLAFSLFLRNPVTGNWSSARRCKVSVVC